MISFRSLTIVTYFWFFVLLFILVIWKTRYIVPYWQVLVAGKLALYRKIIVSGKFGLLLCGSKKKGGPAETEFILYFIVIVSEFTVTVQCIIPLKLQGCSANLIT